MEAMQREFEVHLPAGYRDETGRVHRHAALRKMRGHEEALLYDSTLNAGQLVTELLRSCLVRVGDLERVDAGLVKDLYTADRNYLLLELRRITLGDRLLASYRCPHCGADVSVVEDLSQVTVRRLGDAPDVQGSAPGVQGSAPGIQGSGQAPADIEVVLEDGYVDRRGTLHTELALTLPRGSDEELVAPMAAANPMKAQDALMLRCIKRFGTLPRAELEAYGVKILRDLTMGDRQRLQQALHGQMPGVDFYRSLECGRCGSAFKGVMDLQNFFVLS